jgi:hypothetical protein
MGVKFLPRRRPEVSPITTARGLGASLVNKTGQEAAEAEVVFYNIAIVRILLFFEVAAE